VPTFLYHMKDHSFIV